MRTMTGVITIVQEGRFHLLSDDGRHKLFVLDHGAPLEPQDLPPLQAAECRVTLRYADAPDMVAGIAHEIERAV